MSKSIKREPCVSCGHKRPRILDNWPGVHVECFNPACMARGPARASQTEAVRAWNEMCRPRGLQVRGVAR